MHGRSLILIGLVVVTAATTLSEYAPARPIITADNASRLERLAVLPIQNGLVGEIFFTPDSNTMITWNLDGEVLMWRCSTWEKTPLLPVKNPVTRVQAELHTGPLYYGTMAVSPDGRLTVTATGSESGVVIGRTLEGEEVFSFTYGAPVFSLAFSPDGRQLAIGGLRTSIALFVVEPKELAAELVGDHEFISGLAFSADGMILVAAYERPGNVLKVWDMTTLREITTFTHVTTRIDYHDVLFSPTGREIVIATSEDARARFIDLFTHDITREIHVGSAAVYELAFSLDGSLLTSVGEDVRLCSVDLGTTLRTLGTGGMSTGTVAVSPDGTLLAFSVWERGVEVWAVAP